MSFKLLMSECCFFPTKPVQLLKCFAEQLIAPATYLLNRQESDYFQSIKQFLLYYKFKL